MCVIDDIVNKSSVHVPLKNPIIKPMHRTKSPKFSLDNPLLGMHEIKILG